MDLKRLDRLAEGLSRAGKELEAQDRALERLRARLTALDLSLAGAAERLSEMALEAPPAPPAAPAANASPHGGRDGSLPLAARPRAGLWSRLVPAAALACAGVLLAQTARTKPPAFLPLAVPKAAPPPESAPPLPEEEAAARAVALVLSHRPRGSGLAVEEILFPELVAASEGESSPWAVIHAEGLKYRVCFRPYGEALENAPLYEFEADLGTGAVAASAETELALRPSLAAASPSAR